MDYLPAERERGITIQSAAITLRWRDHRLNLIDTPGHADFTFEVERSLRVLDGAVTILDAVAGVEAQTEKVWRQAAARGIPRIAFVNKMDRTGAAFGRAVREIATKLRARPLVTQIPIYKSPTEADATFTGVVDLVTMRAMTWQADGDGKDVKIEAVKDYSGDPGLLSEAIRAREALVEALSAVDEEVVEAFLDHDSAAAIPESILRAAIRRQCIANQLVPVLTGAAFRNIGVQPLLDAVVDYLPSPDDVPAAIVLFNGKARALSVEEDPACALAFKVIIDAQRGPMTFIRVYAGTITRGATLTNATTRGKERAMRVLEVYADDVREVESLGIGQIGVLLGLNETRTGDTLILSRPGAKESKTAPGKNTFALQPITVPPPVFIATLEAHSASELKSLQTALDSLLQEDPSLQTSYDDDTGQTLLSGMGELHLEIASNRLLNDFKARAEVGKLRIGYRETVAGSHTLQELHERSPAVGASQSVELHVSVSELDIDAMTTLPEAEQVDGNHIKVHLPEIEDNVDFTAAEAEMAIRSAVAAALSRGPAYGYPMHNTAVSVSVLSDTYQLGTTLGLLASGARALTSKIVGEMASQQQVVLLEPIMNVHVTARGQRDLGLVMNDLTGQRGGQILSLADDADPDTGSSEDVIDLATVYIPRDPDQAATSSLTSDGTNGHNADAAQQTTTIHARVPLQEMIGYSRALRSLTKGRGAFVMQVDRFDRMPRDRVQRALQT
ncbi:Ribosome-releasing factor 2, mitochondrial [Savitreella phatthalungensis]